MIDVHSRLGKGGRQHPSAGELRLLRVVLQPPQQRLCRLTFQLTNSIQGCGDGSPAPPASPLNSTAATAGAARAVSRSSTAAMCTPAVRCRSMLRFGMWCYGRAPAECLGALEKEGIESLVEGFGKGLSDRRLGM